MAWTEAFTDYRFYIIFVSIILVAIVIYLIAYYYCFKIDCYNNLCKARWSINSSALTWVWLIFLILYGVGTYQAILETSNLNNDDEKHIWIAFGVNLGLVFFYGIFSFLYPYYLFSAILLLLAGIVAVLQAYIIYPYDNGTATSTLVLYALWLFYLAIVNFNLYKRNDPCNPGCCKPCCTEAEKLHQEAMLEKYGVDCTKNNCANEKQMSNTKCRCQSCQKQTPKCSCKSCTVKVCSKCGQNPCCCTTVKYVCSKCSRNPCCCTTQQYTVVNNNVTTQTCYKCQRNPCNCQTYYSQVGTNINQHMVQPTPNNCTSCTSANSSAPIITHNPQFGNQWVAPTNCVPCDQRKSLSPCDSCTPVETQPYRVERKTVTHQIPIVQYKVIQECKPRVVPVHGTVPVSYCTEQLVDCYGQILTEYSQPMVQTSIRNSVNNPQPVSGFNYNSPYPNSNSSSSSQFNSSSPSSQFNSGSSSSSSSQLGSSQSSSSQFATSSPSSSQFGSSQPPNNSTIIQPYYNPLTKQNNGISTTATGQTPSNSDLSQGGNNFKANDFYNQIMNQ